MKSRLQKKEFFVPLSGGAQTGTDPRIGQSPTVTAEEVDFGISGVARKRDPLAVLVGNTAADTPTAFSSDKYIGTLGNSVVFFGEGFQERIGNTTSNFADNSACDILSVNSEQLVTVAQTWLTPGSAHSVAVNSNGAESHLFVCGLRSAVDYGFAEVIGGTTKRRLYKWVPGLDDAVISRPIYNSLSNSVYFCYHDTTVVADAQCKIIKWNADTSAASTSTNAFTIKDAGAGIGGIFDALYYGTLGGNEVAIAAWRNLGSEITISNLNLEAGDLLANSNVTISPSNVGPLDMFFLDSTNVATVVMSANASAVSITVSVDSLSDGAVSHVDDGTVVAATGLTSPRFGYCTGWRINATAGYVLFSYQDSNSRPVTAISSFDVTGGTVTVNADVAVCAGYWPCSRSQLVGAERFVVFNYVGGAVWRSSPTNVDLATAQAPLLLGKWTGNTSANSQFEIVGHISDQRYSTFEREFTNAQISAYFPHSATWDSNSVTLALPSGGFSAPASSTYKQGPGDRNVVRYTVDTSYIGISPVAVGDYLFIPGASPMVYDGSVLSAMGAVEYPEGVIASVGDDASANFANAGGAGTYYYTAVYATTDRLGNRKLSTPSPAVSAVVPDDNTNVIVTVQTPFVWDNLERYLPSEIEIYRTSADGNDFFRIATVNTNVSAQTVSYTDRGFQSFSASTGIDVLLSATALYTMNGELENTIALPHTVCCSHGGRYFYVPATAGSTARYSKSLRAGVAPEFNDILEVPYCEGEGDIKCLLSFNEKLHLFKRSNIFVTYGEPLNDAGSGQGFANPRRISGEHGVSGPRSATQGAAGIFFINSVDGLIYVIGGDEQIQPVGVPVRHYCEAYAYDNVWYAPQDSCVRFSSATVGAPTLSYNYKFGQWSTFKGRYDDGVRAALAAPVGTNGAYVDVVMDVNGNVYVQDQSGTVGTTESYNVNISTSWISLNDLAGYGKFYKWTLLAGKGSSGTMSIDLKTAYDYEPYWADVQTYNADSLVNFSTATQFGAMTTSTVVDNALKLDVNGSRHKTDAIRICVSENAGTSRNSIEIVGARLEVGVRPGSTRLGSGRTVS